MFLLTAFVVLSIGFSFICSILEAALLSLTPSYIAQLKETRPKLHDALNDLKRHIDRPLAAILTLNTIAHTVGATGVGAQVAVVFGDSHVAIASALMTFGILVFSEIIPKTIGATYWRALAPMLPKILRLMVLVLLPFIWLSEMITNRIAKSDDNDVDMRGEIKALARIGLEEKALETNETRTITNILNLHEIPVSKVMTPRTVCATVTPDMSVAQFDEHYGRTQFTRFPVMDGAEQAIGYVHKSDTYHAEDEQTLKSLMLPITEVLDTDGVKAVFNSMLKDHTHIRVVYNDHGSWVGLITMEDVLETILGQDIVDETDNVRNLRRYAKQRWLKRIHPDKH